MVGLGSVIPPAAVLMAAAGTCPGVRLRWANVKVSLNISQVLVAAVFFRIFAAEIKSQFVMDKKQIWKAIGEFVIKVIQIAIAVFLGVQL